MNKNILSVREMQTEDIELIIQYWFGSDDKFLLGMGVDSSKIPEKKEWTNRLTEQLNQSYEEKKSYCIIWQVNDKPIGHSNINKIIFGEEAYMHLHLWNAVIRKKGLGVKFVKMTLPYFFENFKLKKLFCEPYVLNPAPNKALAKIGFKFVKEYKTIPGWLNFEQSVNLWELSHDRFI